MHTCGPLCVLLPMDGCHGPHTRLPACLIPPEAGLEHSRTDPRSDRRRPPGRLLTARPVRGRSPLLGPPLSPPDVMQVYLVLSSTMCSSIKWGAHVAYPLVAATMTLDLHQALVDCPRSTSFPGRSPCTPRHSHSFPGSPDLPLARAPSHRAPDTAAVSNSLCFAPG